MQPDMDIKKLKIDTEEMEKQLNEMVQVITPQKIPQSLFWFLLKTVVFFIDMYTSLYTYLYFWKL